MVPYSPCMDIPVTSIDWSGISVQLFDVMFWFTKLQIEYCWLYQMLPRVEQLVWKGRLTQPSSLHFWGLLSKGSLRSSILVKCLLSTFLLYKWLLLIINTLFSYFYFSARLNIPPNNKGTWFIFSFSLFSILLLFYLFGITYFLHG